MEQHGTATVSVGFDFGWSVAPCCPLSPGAPTIHVPDATTPNQTSQIKERKTLKKQGKEIYEAKGPIEGTLSFCSFSLFLFWATPLWVTELPNPLWSKPLRRYSRHSSLPGGPPEKQTKGTNEPESNFVQYRAVYEAFVKTVSNQVSCKTIC